MAEENLPRYAWPSILQKAAFMNNASANSSTKYSPYELMYGTPPTLPSVISSPSINTDEAVATDDYIEEIQSTVMSKWNDAAVNLDNAKQQYKKYYDQGNVIKQKDIKVGDFVYVKNQTRKSSLDPYFLGPFEVLSVDECTATLHYNRRGPVAVHKNNIRVSQTADIVVLPCAEAPLEPPPATQGPAEEGKALDVPDEAARDGSPEAAGLDLLELPIALRKPHRCKPKPLGADFVPS